MPVSPVRRTALPVGATCSTRWRTRTSAGLLPTISSKPCASRTSSLRTTFSASARSFRRESSARLARRSRSARARTIELARISPNSRKRVRSEGDQSRPDFRDDSESRPIGFSPIRSGNMRFDWIPRAATNARSSAQDSGISSGRCIANPSPWRARRAQFGTSRVGPFGTVVRFGPANEATTFVVSSSSKSRMLPRSAPKNRASRSMARSSSVSKSSAGAARRLAVTSARVASKSSASPGLTDAMSTFHHQWRHFALMRTHQLFVLTCDSFNLFTRSGLNRRMPP